MAALLAKSPYLEINPDEVQTNIVVVGLRPPLDEQTFCAELQKNDVLLVPFGRARVRAVAHLDIDDHDIESAAQTIIETAAALSESRGSIV